MTVKRISWLLITRVIKKSLHVLFLLLLFFYLLELPICTNSLRCKSALFSLRLQDLKWYWQKIWRGKKLQYNQTQGKFRAAMNDGKLIFLVQMGKKLGKQTAFTRLVHICHMLLVIKGQLRKTSYIMKHSDMVTLT